MSNYTLKIIEIHKQKLKLQNIKNQQIIVLVVVLIIFGVGRLPEIGGAMGKAIKEFRSSQDKSADEQLAQSEKEN